MLLALPGNTPGDSLRSTPGELLKYSVKTLQNRSGAIELIFARCCGL